ncbi:MAG TPA: cobalt-precorrin-6A reductase [Stellaceae bacterium]|nr:cobalt-precorrin-6A reductase [Stellaceae bacterium]
MTPHLLILGGTAEAAALAQECARFGDRLLVTTSLAGRTAAPAPLPGAVRLGGFGGADGLAGFLEEARIDLLVDATHPFASRISHHARLAAARVHVPRLLLQRPAWQRAAGDRWIEVADMAAAAAAVPRLGKRALLTVGARSLAAFAAIDSVHFVVRLIDPPLRPLPLGSYTVVLGRGPFALDAERQLLHRHAIEVLVAKASGGAGTVAKLAAARAAGIPVVMVARPEPEPGAAVASVAEAVTWIAARLAVIEEAAR